MPMDATPRWSDADADGLRQQRLAAGVDRETLARVICLSLAQVRQLEDGGDSSFYTPAIKRGAGLRALAWLSWQGDAPAQAQPATSSSPLTPPPIPAALQRS